MIRHYERELADDAGDYMTWIGFACKDGDGRSVKRYTREKQASFFCLRRRVALPQVHPGGDRPL